MTKVLRRGVDPEQVVGWLKQIARGAEGDPFPGQWRREIGLVAAEHLPGFVGYPWPHDFDSPREERVGGNGEAEVGSAVLGIHEMGAGKVEPSRAPQLVSVQIDCCGAPRVGPVERGVGVAAVEFNGEAAARRIEVFHVHLSLHGRGPLERVIDPEIDVATARGVGRRGAAVAPGHVGGHSRAVRKFELVQPGLDIGGLQCRADQFHVGVRPARQSGSDPSLEHVHIFAGQFDVSAAVLFGRGDVGRFVVFVPRFHRHDAGRVPEKPRPVPLEKTASLAINNQGRAAWHGRVVVTGSE